MSIMSDAFSLIHGRVCVRARARAIWGANASTPLSLSGGMGGNGCVSCHPRGGWLKKSIIASVKP